MFLHKIAPSDLEDAGKVGLFLTPVYIQPVFVRPFVDHRYAKLYLDGKKKV